jgi:toxin YoeB
MKLLWTSDGWDDYLYWLDEDRKIVGTINGLIKDIKRDPFKGLGKPEPLKHALQGWWSRRITSEHRLVYRMTGQGQDQRVEILQCRYHY